MNKSTKPESGKKQVYKNKITVDRMGIAVRKQANKHRNEKALIQVYNYIIQLQNNDNKLKETTRVFDRKTVPSVSSDKNKFATLKMYSPIMRTTPDQLQPGILTM